MEITHQGFVQRSPWNKGKLVGQKAPLKQREIWAIRIRLQLAEPTRELALFNLAVDSKLRSCDLVHLRVKDVAHGDQVANRAIVMQQKTRRPEQFEITEQTRESIAQYARIVRSWVRQIGLNPAGYGTRTLRRTKAALIYRGTKNLRAVQLLLGHSKLGSTVRYLGIRGRRCS
jgi:integrase